VNRLEERYRRVLRLLPASYREVWEDDMVATLLASVETDDPDDAAYTADFGRPSWSEVASVLALAVRLRLGSGGGQPRYAAWGGAIRLAALCGLLAFATGSVVIVFSALWAAELLPGLPPPPPVPEPGPPGRDLWQGISDVGGLLWLPSCLALVLGRWTIAKWLARLAVVALTVSDVRTAVADLDVITASIMYELLLTWLVVLALVAFHRDAPPVRRRPWLIALACASAVVTGHVVLFLYLSPTTIPPVDWPGLGSAAVVGTAIWYLIARRRGHITPIWGHALAILAVAELGLRVTTLLDYGRFGIAWHPAAVPLGVAEAVAVLGVAVLLGLCTARDLRRRSSTSGVRTW
jgi:hypothetical protein